MQNGNQCRPGRLFGVPLSRSFVVGGHPHDVEPASNAGARGVYVLTGHGKKHRAELKVGGQVVENIAKAAQWILEQPVLGADR